MGCGAGGGGSGLVLRDRNGRARDQTVKSGLKKRDGLGPRAPVRGGFGRPSGQLEALRRGSSGSQGPRRGAIATRPADPEGWPGDVAGGAGWGRGVRGGGGGCGGCGVDRGKTAPAVTARCRLYLPAPSQTHHMSENRARKNASGGERGISRGTKGRTKSRTPNGPAPAQT
jgi:hypothetical protein